MVELFSQLLGMGIGGALGLWYHTVKRFPSKVSLWHFTLAIGFLLIGLASGVEIVKLVYTAFACVFIFLSAICLMTRDNGKDETDVVVWTGALAVLMWITGVFTLWTDYANTKEALNPLIIGMAASMLSYVFRQRGGGAERRVENL